MKARLPQGYGRRRSRNICSSCARQAQKMQEQMEQTTTELEAKEYTAAAGGGAVVRDRDGQQWKSRISTFKPEVVDPE